MSNSFFVFLPSNVTDYPDNQPNKFRVRLPKTLHFNGSWVCGLHSISYPYSWSTIGTLDAQWIDIHFTDRHAFDEDRQRVIRVPVPKASHSRVEQLRDFLAVTLRNRSGAKLLPTPREVEANRNRTKLLDSPPPLKREKRDAPSAPMFDASGKRLQDSPPLYNINEDERLEESPPPFEETKDETVKAKVSAPPPPVTSPVKPTTTAAKTPTAPAGRTPAPSASAKPGAQVPPPKQAPQSPKPTAKPTSATPVKSTTAPPPTVKTTTAPPPTLKTATAPPPTVKSTTAAPPTATAPPPTVKSTTAPPPTVKSITTAPPPTVKAITTAPPKTTTTATTPVKSPSVKPTISAPPAQLKSPAKPPPQTSLSAKLAPLADSPPRFDEDENKTDKFTAAKPTTPAKPSVKTKLMAAPAQLKSSSPPPQQKHKVPVKPSAPVTIPAKGSPPRFEEQQQQQRPPPPTSAALTLADLPENTLSVQIDPLTYVPNSVSIQYVENMERFKLVFNEAIVSHVSFSPQLGYVLGFENPQHVVSNELSKYPVDLRGGISSFAVYSKGLTENMIIGNSLSSLLRVVSISGAIPGEYNEKIYDSPIFARVLPREINEIEIELRTMDKGRLVPFAYGTTMVVLIFKKVINF
ncbi:hypothetical protein niasHT_030030 [Heterodera trifolii]|uniref:Uncharacterized protein n=1 Tax=Heterodera trifolii TaxID=157864 RepID=A0ABD2JQH3_9BILA